MTNSLKNKLHTYLVQNNPDVLVILQGRSNVTSFLEEKVNALGGLPEQLLAEGKPTYIIEEICMDELTKGLRPSRYNYLLSLLENDFQTEYSRWQESGVLTYEIINLLQTCNLVFDSLKFTDENEDDRMLRYAIIGTIRQYLIEGFVDAEYLDKIDFGTR